MAITGKIQDVVVDLRENSSTFLQTFSCELVSEQPSALL
ncbi:MAG: dTDP-4-keto-6-deoxy-D-glucose epimerase, partial [Flammeovirgaceae bacterium]|nr:dTDP-4-keto-6-deoxy-D-glucose epimerase [Flammeovirgaceae bacterium]